MAKGVSVMSETEILQNILLTLGARPDLCRIWRNNTGALPDKNGRMIKFGIPGSPDILGILTTGQWLGIEVKAEKGRQSEQQKRFQTMIERFNGVYILARSVQEAIDGVTKAIKGATSMTKCQPCTGCKDKYDELPNGDPVPCREEDGNDDL